ncbi:(d)CMP kinase [Sutterella massiliensis]|uniref:Cytidylate kinase n=1 Tax=Sutterella massiliensis TaxID=1816689 RepID=A0ABS2DTR8_9BURK|nr:(d)CMP kinase [Sutterella massiliensis]MBM6704093.1 (d)CMP kinase [Sutterella massiliensis]
MQDIPVITIDGPAASGKGTIAARVARSLGFHYLDSGALYRLATFAALKHGISLDDAAALAAQAANLDPVFDGEKILFEGEDVSTAIRSEAVSSATSQVAAIPEVREALFNLQRRFARAPGLVADGRDMGTVIFPKAELKVFLTATARVRAERRYKQLVERGEAADLDALTRDLEARDKRDRERETAPLRAAIDAYILDTSEMDIESVEKKVLEWWQSR